jgi:hypothetical protein
MPRTTANPVKAAYEKVITAFDKLPGKHVRFRDFSADNLDGVSEILRTLGGEPQQIASFIGAGDNFTTVNYYPEAKIYVLLDRHDLGRTAVFLKSKKAKHIERVEIQLMLSNQPEILDIDGDDFFEED